MLLNAKTLSGCFHHNSGSQMALHSSHVSHKFHVVLVDIWSHLVVDCLCSRGLPGGEHGQDGGRRVHPLRPRQHQLRLGLPVQRGDPAHHRVRVEADHGGVPRGHHHAVHPERGGGHHPGLYGRRGLCQACSTQEEEKHCRFLKVSLS